MRAFTDAILVEIIRTGSFEIRHSGCLKEGERQTRLQPQPTAPKYTCQACGDPLEVEQC